MTARKSFFCDDCSRGFVSRQTLGRHWLSFHGPGSTSRQLLVEPKRRKLNYVAEPIVGLPNQEDPWIVPSRDGLIEMGYDPECVHILRENWRYIATTYRKGKILRRYNIRLSPEHSLNVTYLKQMLTAVYHDQTTCFKFNFTFSVMLHNQSDKVYRFFWAGNQNQNNVFYEAPASVGTLDEMDEKTSLLDYEDIMAHLTLGYPDTKWSLHSVVGFHVVVYKPNEIPLMGDSTDNGGLPDFLNNHAAIRCLYKNTQGRIFNDKNCFWRCLSVFLQNGEEVRLQHHAKLLSRTYSIDMGHGDVPYTIGMTMEDMIFAERLFKIRIFIYRLTQRNDDDDDAEVGGGGGGRGGRGNDRLQSELVRRSRFSRKDSPQGDLYLNIHTLPNGSDHLSWIRDIEIYCRWYRCPICGYGSSRRDALTVHERSCKSSAIDRVSCKGGGFSPRESIFERMESFGFVVNESDRFTWLYSVWDLETMCNPLPVNKQKSSPESGLCWESTLEITSCSIASNCPNFLEPRFFKRTATEDELVDQIVDYMSCISTATAQLNKDRLQHLFDQIDMSILDCELKEEDDNLLLSMDVKNYYTDKKSLLCELRKSLLDFAEKQCFFSFNGARFDVKIIRNKLCRALHRRGVTIENVIKRNGSYVLLASENMKLMDIACYCAAGTSLDKWARGLGLAVQKGQFPHEHITSLDVLDQSEFPQHSAFYSSLSDSNISLDDYNELKQMYEKQGFKSLWELLEWYGNQDVIVTLAGVAKMCEFWREQGIDLPTQAVSLPGLAQQLMGKMTPKTKPIIYLPSKQHYELYEWSRRAVVGGPSIVFKRLVCAGVTKIRNGPNICANVTGLDANSLYLLCLSLDMPLSIPCDWKWDSENNIFRKKFCLPSYVSLQETEFCHHLIHSLGGEGKYLFSYFQRHQVRLGKRKFTADCLSYRLNTIWSFDGCWPHFCAKCVTGQRAAYNAPELAATKRREDMERDEYIKSIGFKHVKITGCEWLKLRERPEVKNFLNETMRTPMWNKFSASERQLIESIKNDKFFGLLEVDMKCPDHLMEYFSEAPPLFVHMDIERRHLSEEMLQIAENFGILKRPRRSLVSVRNADNIIITSVMLKWLLGKGMECQKLHRAVEFKPFKLYEGFASEVTKHRTAADTDPNLKVVGDLFKTVGNSGYGKMIECREKYLKTKMCTMKEAGRMVNLKNFRNLETMGEDDGSVDQQQLAYEVSVLPRKFQDNTPRFLGIFVLNYAKLILLQFYYDFLLKFWDKKDFELIYTDTDSWYIALSSPTWTEHELKVKSHLRQQYQCERKLFLVDSETMRKPGLFKEEFVGEAMVCLNSKLYIVVEKTTAEVSERCRRLLHSDIQLNQQTSLDSTVGVGNAKFSAKGTNRRQNKEILTVDRYLDVIETKETIAGKNSGFTFRNGVMYRFSLEKSCLQYFYCKRLLNDDFSSSPIH